MASGRASSSSRSSKAGGTRRKARPKKLPFKRVLLKISGESLLGEREFGVDPDMLGRIAREIAGVHELGVEIAIVVGGGNIWRGATAAELGTDRVTADHMGMLATVINGLALQDALERSGATTRLMTAMEIREVAEPYIRRRGIRHLEKGRVIVLAGGTGNPYFTTDTAASLRALELRCDVILKATKVEGVFDKDPEVHADAVRLNTVSFDRALAERLRVMDSTAVSMCRDNDLPIVVFNIRRTGNIKRAATGQKVGSRVG